MGATEGFGDGTAPVVAVVGLALGLGLAATVELTVAPVLG